MSIVFIRVDLTLAVTPVQYDYEKVRTLQIRIYIYAKNTREVNSLVFGTSYWTETTDIFFFDKII